MSTYLSVLDKIVSRGKRVVSKRVDNNTYAELRNFVPNSFFAPATVEEWQAAGAGLGVRAVAVRLHKTDIVTYTEEGRCILNSGGWKTVTTKARINDWSPLGVTVGSIKGEWRVYCGGWDKSVPFADGITLVEQHDGDSPYYVPVEGTYPDESQEKQAADAKKKLRADIKAYLAKADRSFPVWAKKLKEEGRLSTSADCFYCQGVVTDAATGATSDDNGHLWSHLREGYVFPSLFLKAYADKGYRDPQFVFALDITAGVDGGKGAKELLGKYLFKRLSISAEPQGNTALLEGYVAAAVEALEKPSDFGYFGSDDALWNTSAPTWTKHRDSELIEIANFEYVLKTLKAEFPDLVPDDLDEDDHPARDFNGGPSIYVFGASHWAVGHIDQIVVPVKLDGSRPVAVDNLHPAFIRICEFRDRANAYPLLDGAEDIHSRLEAEAQREEAAQYLADPTEEQVSKLIAAVLDDQGGEWPGYLDEEQWARIVAEQELPPATWLESRTPGWTPV